MESPDLSSLNESQRQELIIKLLFETKAMMLVYLEREAKRMGTGPTLTAEEAGAYLVTQYQLAREAQWDKHGVHPDTQYDTEKSLADI